MFQTLKSASRGLNLLACCCELNGYHELKIPILITEKFIYDVLHE